LASSSIRRVGSLVLRADRHAEAAAPFLKLRDRGRTKGVACREQHAALLAPVAMRELADGGGFPGAVDADNQQHERFVPADIERFHDRFEQFRQLRSQRGAQCRGIGELAFARAPAQIVYERGRGAHPDIGGQQGDFQFVQQVV
jgi:hypothetical protein